MYGSSSNLSSLYGSTSRTPSVTGMASNVGWIVLFSLIAGVLIYFLFMGKRNENKFTGFLGWMYDFLHFKKLAVEGILKILYITSALYITIMSFSMISVNFLGFLGFLVGGNVLVRIGYELMLVLLIVCKNTSEINKKMSDKQ